MLIDQSYAGTLNDLKIAQQVTGFYYFKSYGLWKNKYDPAHGIQTKTKAFISLSGV
jgi:hypothetical protein